MLLVTILIELIGIAVIAAGIGLEVAYGGQIYLVVITIGSCLVATGGLIFAKVLKRK